MKLWNVTTSSKTTLSGKTLLHFVSLHPRLSLDGKALVFLVTFCCDLVVRHLCG